jgi:hypothetical protein
MTKELRKSVSLFNKAISKIENLEHENNNLRFMLYRLYKNNNKINVDILSKDEIEMVKNCWFKIEDDEILILPRL